MNVTTATKTETHIGKVRSRNKSQIHQVGELLGWTDQQYCNHQFDEYCKFVERLSHDYPIVRKQILYSAYFRGMWNSEWMVRNESEFIPYAIEACFDLPEITAEYLFVHSHVRLLHDEGFMSRYSRVLKLICIDERKENCNA